MPVPKYPILLTERLGEDVYTALAEMVDDRRDDKLIAIDGKLTALSERVDGRLAAFDEKLTALSDRVDGKLAAFDEKLAALSDRVDGKLAAFDGRLAAFDGKLTAMSERFERRLMEECGGIRLEMRDLRTEMVQGRADLLKWAMVFWVSQAAAVAGIVTALR